jgi:threonine/homoserine/homoserine lactone efflux protein
MIEISTLALFSGAVLMLMLSPGPNMAFVIGHGVAYGWRGGVAAALGIGAADLVLTALTTLGVTALVAQWPPAFDVIRWAGAVYLLWMAWQAWRRPGVLPAGQAAESSLAALAGRAMFNSLLNPKALLFFMVFLPQFADAARGPLAPQLLTLGIVLTVIAAGFHAALGALGGWVSKRMTGNARAARWQSRGLSFVLVLLAFRLATLQRPQ